MASLKGKKTMQSLLKKGFTKTNSHHHIFEFWHNKKLIASTRTSHNDQDINDPLITAMSKQCLMDRDFFVAFAQCTKSKDDYIQLLETKGEIKEGPAASKAAQQKPANKSRKGR
jgi:hypothetical protein